MKKVKVLHLWHSEKEAERVVRQLARSGVDFEAKLVRAESDYVSALVRGGFDLIVADCRAEFEKSSADDLAMIEIAAQVAPQIPFVLICDGPDLKPDPAVRCFARDDLNGFEPLLKELARG